MTDETMNRLKEVLSEEELQILQYRTKIDFGVPSLNDEEYEDFVFEQIGKFAKNEIITDNDEEISENDNIMKQLCEELTLVGYKLQNAESVSKTEMLSMKDSFVKTMTNIVNHLDKTIQEKIDSLTSTEEQ